MLATNRYDPYGSLMSHSGDATSVYGFTGEQLDAATGLEYLRARYYSPAEGRFTTRDVWQGDPTSPMSYNGWLYAYANAINLTDPSGRFATTVSNRAGAGPCYDPFLCFFLLSHGVLLPGCETANLSSTHGLGTRLTGREAICNADYCYVNLGVSVGWVLVPLVSVCPDCAPAVRMLQKMGTSVGVNYIWDAYGNNYLQLWGAPFGKSPWPINWNLVSGDILSADMLRAVGKWTKGDNPEIPWATSQEVSGFVTGWSGTGTIGAFGTWGLTMSQSGATAFEWGMFSPPQASVSGGYTWKLPPWLPP